ncbi:MAG: hypothetical protein K6F46_10950 [Desulfovibrio sp.]|nr:hypothetical protein [Desulfovibrio sp.]
MAEETLAGQVRDDPCRYRLRVKDSLLGEHMLFVAFGALVLGSCRS